jgi:xylulokinase
MIRAVLEGVTMNLRIILEAFLRQGAQISAMRVIGGGARGLFWNQMMADMYEMPIQRLAILEEATSMGAALAGGIGVGLYPDFNMSRSMNPVVSSVDPEPAAQVAYEKLYPIFEALYEALVPVYDMLVEVP